MTISGFSFIRNGNRLAFPFTESLRSLLPLCDEVVVAVGDSDDGTRESVESLGAQHLRIIDTVWDEQVRTDGLILSQQTNVALAACKGDWCIYLQGDEVLHEEDYSLLRKAINNAAQDERVEALLFRWKHFYGSYQYTGVGRQWYRREIRAFRNSGTVLSWGDAQGFRTKNPDGSIRKLRACQTEARIFHYGWVRHPRVQSAKQLSFNRLYHDDLWVQQNVPSAEEFEYGCYETAQYNGTHPAIMQQRIERDREWTSRYDASRAKPRPLLVSVLDSIEKLTGLRIGEYKNFEEIR